MRKMIESGIDWIGDIPTDWKVIANKHLMKKVKKICTKYSGEDVLSLTMKGVVIRDLDNPFGKMPATFDGYQFVEAGNLLMCLFDIDVTPRCIGLVKNNGVCSPAYSQFQLNEVADAEYYYYYYLNLDFTKELLHLAKNLRHSLTEEQLGAVPTALPSIEEQHRIVAFLDKKCSQVDDLIYNVQTQIDKLKHYKQSLITEVVTKGLDATVTMKDSGVEWIGKIPEHWIVVKNNVIFSNFTDKGHGEAEVLSIYRELGVIPKSSRDDNHNVTSLDTDSYKYIETGDLVINKMKAWSGSLAISNYSGIVSPAYYTCKVNKNIVDLHYIHHYLRNRAIVGVYEMYSAGLRIGQWDLGIQDFLNIQIAIPADLEEQKEIAEYLDLKCSQIDKLIEIKQKKIDKLNEYKKSLIYEYVTGKKEAV